MATVLVLLKIKFYPTHLKFEFQPLRNVIKHCLQSRLFASTYFFHKGAVSDLRVPLVFYRGAPKGEIMTIFAKIDILYQTKIRCIKKELWHDHDFKLYNTHGSGVHKNTKYLGNWAQDGGKLSPFVLTAIR